MKKSIYILILIFISSCSSNQGVYWCGDHPCIDKKEKEAYFKKTMIVEVRNYDKNEIQENSEIQKLLNQAKIDEKNRKLSDKELKKQAKLEEKRRIKEEKELKKQIKIDEKRRIKEEKELEKQIKIDEKKAEKIRKHQKNNIKKNKSTKIGTPAGNIEIPQEKFQELVKKIIKRNSSRSYPEINDIPK